IAYTGQSTYTPDFMLAFNQQATGVVANVVQALAVVPPVIQGIALLVIAGLVAWLAWRSPVEKHRASNKSLDNLEESPEEVNRDETEAEESLSQVAARDERR